MISKYPVTSPQGHEYKVEIEEFRNILGDKGIEVRVYEVVEKKVFLFFNILSQNYVHGNYFDSDKIEYLHYVKAVKKAIENYEGSIEYKKKHSHLDNMKRFEEWDGNC